MPVVGGGLEKDNMSSKEIGWYVERLLKKLNRDYDDEMKKLCSTDELLTSSVVPHHNFEMIARQNTMHSQLEHRKREVTNRFRHKKQQLELLFKKEPILPSYTPKFVNNVKAVLSTDYLVDSVNDFVVKLLDYVHDDIDEEDEEEDENE